MDTFIAKVIPGNIVLRQVFDGIVRGSLRGLEQTWFMRLGVSDREAIDGPAGSARPSCIGTKPLVGMSKQPIALGSAVGKLQLCVSWRATVQVKFLTIVAGAVVNRLNNGAVGADEPFRRSARMAFSNLAPFGIPCLSAHPPKNLQVHHRIDNRVVAVQSPGSDQVSFRVVELFESFGGTHSAGA